MSRQSSPRLARVYDGRDGDGRPHADRVAVDPGVLDAVLTYLEAAPVVLAARGFDVDEFAPRERDVPLNFRTDGEWVWAGSVPHYLRKYGLPPEPDLLAHIADRGFRIGEVAEAAKDRAVELVIGG
ncbi:MULTISPECIES: hypothetical protein [unclassified Nocardia]|uniref:hypothetical protein n=1 Tax=unclassified Nocardia TaxID=2637762 RepID=UPI00278C8ADE|nr:MULTISPECIES: hypothetical protein [unclassified Nocardia]